jgi:hypothetical protein
MQRMVTAAVFDAKPYDRESLQLASASRGIEWRFLEFRLTRGALIDTAVANLEALASGKPFVETRC